MKKVWIAVGSMVVILAIILVALAIMGRETVQESGDVTSRYHYVYCESKEGLKLRIDGPFPKGYRWEFWQQEDCVTVTEETQSESRAEFLLTPAEHGQSAVVFSLQKAGGPLTERDYELIIMFRVFPDGVLEVSSNTHYEPNSMVGADTENFNYRVTEELNGTMTVYVEDPEDSRWAVTTRGNSVEVDRSAVDPEQHTVTFTISYTANGTSDVYLYQRSSGYEIKLRVANDSLKRVQLENHGVVDYIAETYTGVTDRYDQLIGDVLLPEEAEVISVDTIPWLSKADQITQYTVGRVIFTWGAAQFTLVSSDVAELSDLAADHASACPEPETITDKGTTAYLYKMPEKAAAAWETKDGFRYLLTGANADDLDRVVEELLLLTAGN